MVLSSYIKEILYYLYLLLGWVAIHHFLVINNIIPQITSKTVLESIGIYISIEIFIVFVVTSLDTCLFVVYGNRSLKQIIYGN